MLPHIAVHDGSLGMTHVLSKIHEYLPKVSSQNYKFT